MVHRLFKNSPLLMSRYVLAWFLLLTTLTLSAQSDSIPPVTVPPDTVPGGILPVDTLIVDTIAADTIAADSAITCAIEVGVAPMAISAVPTAAKEPFFKRLFHKRLRKFKEDYKIDSIHSIKDVDSIMAVKYQKTGTYDTLYLARPKQRFTARLRMNVSGSSINTKGHYKEMPFDSHLKTPNRITTSIGLAYRGIGLSISVNPAKLKGESHTTEFNFNYYANRYGVEVSYQNSKDFSGWTTASGEQREFPADLMQSKILNLSAYYAFNYRKFSYPAAFTQSYIQRRSAGSWMLALSFLSGTLDASGIPDLGSFKLSMGNIGIGGGYGYNWVINSHWMVHASALPTIVVGSFNYLTIGGSKERVSYSFPELILTERVAILYQFHKNHFAGLTFVAYNTIHGTTKKLRLSHNKWRLRITYGIRF